MSETVNRLFVYGTLAPGCPNHDVVADIHGVWQKAFIRGNLVEQGWGAALGFPGIRLTESGDFVEGQLLTSNVLSAHWDRLDEFEGEAYERCTTKALLDVDGSSVSCQVYSLRESKG